MTYNKPHILVLGNASSVIQNCNQKTSGTSDGHGCAKPSGNTTAYDLDD